MERGLRVAALLFFLVSITRSTPPTNRPPTFHNWFNENLTTATEQSSLSQVGLKEKSEENNNGEITSQISEFRQRFTLRGTHIESYLDTVRRGIMTQMTGSTQFLKLLRDEYMSQLPKNRTKLVPETTRAQCFCEGKTQTPCPKRCVRSCFAVQRGYGGHGNYDDCSKIDYSSCYCHQESSVSCNDGAISNCFEQTMVDVPDDNITCAQFIINESNVEESFKRYANLLLEPAKKYLREAEFKLSALKQAVVASELLSNVTLGPCQTQNDSNCVSEASKFLVGRLEHYRQLNKNITMILLRTQNQMETARNDLYILKEQTLTQINRQIKNYSSCLKSLGFLLDDPDNKSERQEKDPQAPTGKTMVLPVSRSQRCLSTEFLCTNLLCIPDMYVCDGANDCGDNSDEADCD